MNEPKFTKGPWIIGTEGGNGEGYIFANEGRMKMTYQGSTLYSICKMTTGFEEHEDKANANLIAAAPELYEALSGLDNAINAIRQELGTQYPALAEAWIEARIILKKARGEL